MNKFDVRVRVYCKEDVEFIFETLRSLGERCEDNTFEIERAEHVCLPDCKGMASNYKAEWLYFGGQSVTDRHALLTYVSIDKLIKMIKEQNG
jgi:hypothetical protein